MNSATLLVLFVITFVQLTQSHPPDHPAVSQTLHAAKGPENHDASYDHKAFLGEEEANKFKDLTPEESKRRLGKIVKKIDVNGDGIVTASELTTWINNVAKATHDKEVSTQWEAINKNNATEIDFDTFTLNMYGPPEERLQDTEMAERYKEYLERDKRRWKAADLDGNNKLNKEEFASVIRAEGKPHMLETQVQELMESMDLDKDQKISLAEFITDVGKSMNANPTEAKPGTEWAKRFEEDFNIHRDHNKDGFLDFSELREWISPTNYDAVKAEVQHLIYYADANKDGNLSESEIVDKFDLFVGSQATDYGRELEHEEL